MASDSTREQVVALSLDLENETGFDSISTIERLYDGECCFPDCAFRTRDALKMWKHVHFGRKHGKSFGATLDELLRTRADRIGESL